MSTWPAAHLPPPAGASATDTVLDDPVEHDGFTRWHVDRQGRRRGESSFALSGLHCAACAGLIERALCGVPGVDTARVGAAAERATVCWDPARTSPSQLIDAVRRAGYGAVPDAAAPAREQRRQDQRSALWRLFVAAFCAMQVMMLATPAYVAGPGDLAPDLKRLLDAAAWVLTLPVLAFAAEPFFAGAWRALRQHRIGMDVPVALGVLITFVASTGAAFDPGGAFGSEVYFDSLTMFVSLLLAARYLEMRVRHAAAQSLEQAFARMPEVAWRIEDDDRVAVVSVHRLRPGDRIRVPVGQAFGADGVIESGRTQADESMLSGESAPVVKCVGDAVLAGSLNLAAPVSVRVQQVGADTRVQCIVAMMQGALSQRPAAAAVADRWAAPFLWGVLVLACGAALAWQVVDPARALWVAVSVLIVTCPCALSLAAPATLVAAARGLARRGVVLQRLGALESLAGVQQVFFDKTGTLTEGQPRLSGTTLTEAGQRRFGGVDEATSAAAGIAGWSQHPLCRALCAAAPGDAASGSWTAIGEVPGCGVEARDPQGRVWRLGAAGWVEAPASAADRADPASQVALACDGQRLITFDFAETLRADAAATVQALQADGLHVALLSGDAPAPAHALAARLGIVDVRAAATPEMKLSAVALAQGLGRRVAMVGDGINDAPVLARADVSLAMGHGALLARAHADVIVVSNRLDGVRQALRSARRAMRIVHQNLVWAVAYNVLAIPMAVAGLLPPWAAGLGMAGSSLVVVLNAIRAAR